MDTMCFRLKSTNIEGMQAHKIEKIKITGGNLFGKRIIAP